MNEWLIHVGLNLLFQNFSFLPKIDLCYLCCTYVCFHRHTNHWTIGIVWHIIRHRKCCLMKIFCLRTACRKNLHKRIPSSPIALLLAAIHAFTFTLPWLLYFPWIHFVVKSAKTAMQTCGVDGWQVYHWMNMCEYFLSLDTTRRQNKYISRDDGVALPLPVRVSS